MAEGSNPQYDERLPWMAGRLRRPDDRRSSLDLLGEEVLALYD